MIEELEEESQMEGVDFGAIEEEDILGMASEAPIIRAREPCIVSGGKAGCVRYSY